MDDTVLRKNLIELLDGGSAHVDLRRALAGVRPENRAAHPAPGMHSVWDQLEHMRLAQEDILRYTLDASWSSPPWPEGYWPAATDHVEDDEWQRAVDAFFRDLEDIKAMAVDQGVDLTAEIPHGEGRTYLRQVLLVADHNAYHAGELVVARKLLGDWNG